jgi:hypothetical protein
MVAINSTPTQVATLAAKPTPGPTITQALNQEAAKAPAPTSARDLNIH